MDRSGRENYMYQYFCTVTTRSAGPLWPAGSYCINRKGDCPENFETGSQSTTCETTKSKSNSGGDFPSGSYSSSGQTMGFCCREDGNASIPVHLPTQKPFYLYRFGGKCQQVDGMVVLEESMTLHCHVTGHENVVPDGGRDGSPIYRVELCYYYRA
ncbi:uncharacterized protein LOC101864043 [Aplysia californica]|uniref:Uncharacterized protein LOC101864043 n=1 Tax=Aplysia californica TaxID=6500 RepID=A0ABM0KAU8_APLCA|nr:uncharacterized protein LOC101864043 [Aplysia californica]